MNRVGFGFDVHRLATERRFLGGTDSVAQRPPRTFRCRRFYSTPLRTPCSERPLSAISASFDFLDTDNRYKDISSLTLLENVYQLLTQRKLEIINVDSTVVLQSPKIAPYIERMRTNIAAVLHINISQVSVKATTNEDLGFIGSSEWPVVLINTPVCHDDPISILAEPFLHFMNIFEREKSEPFSFDDRGSEPIPHFIHCQEPRNAAESSDDQSSRQRDRSQPAQISAEHDNDVAGRWRENIFNVRDGEKGAVDQEGVQRSQRMDE